MQGGTSVGCLFLVHLVQFHDAPWPLGPGAAADAAEAEAAARTRRHESAALRQRRHPYNGSINHGMLGLWDWHTQSCAGGSPLFCSLLSGGRKCSTNPLSVHKTSAVQANNIRNSPIPRALRRERGTAVWLTQ